MISSCQTSSISLRFPPTPRWPHRRRRTRTHNRPSGFLHPHPPAPSVNIFITNMWTSLQSPDHHDQHCGKLPASFSRVSWRGFSSAISFRTSSVSPPSWTMSDLIPVHVLVIFWWLTIRIFKMTEREFVEKGDYGQRRKPWRSREDGVAPGWIHCWLSLRKTTEDQ